MPDKPVADKPLWMQESFWFSLLGGMAAAPAVLEPLFPFIPEWWRARLVAVAAVCALIAARRAREPGAQARAALGGPEAVKAQIEQQAQP